jgi:septum formation protein
MELILASTSPRRRDLLSSHGYRFQVIAPQGVVEWEDADALPGDLTLSNARLKARAVAALCPDVCVLGVDTVVAFRGEVLGKPPTMAAAMAMLERLNGNIHEVYSGVWLVDGMGRTEHGFVEVTRVRFRDRTETERRAYLERIHPLDKAGGYAAQDDGGEMIETVEGSFTNVIGLPMERLGRLLGKIGGKVAVK